MFEVDEDLKTVGEVVYYESAMGRGKIVLSHCECHGRERFACENHISANKDGMIL